MAFTKRVFVLPSFAIALRRAIGISAALGYPKREGQALDARSPPPRIVPFFVRPKRPPVGHPLEGQGVLILPIDYAPLVALDGTTISIPATYAGQPVPGGAGSFVLDLSAGVAFDRTQHDVPEEDPVT